jgi:AcrR family transcriptional regulator
MGSSERKQRQKQALRESILHTAQHIAKQEGWECVTIRRIASAVEYSTPVIYEHFAGKDAILQELLLQGFRQLRKDLEAAKNQEQEPEKQLLAVSLACLTFVINHRELYQVMFGLEGIVPPAHPALDEIHLTFKVVEDVMDKVRQDQQADLFSLLDYWWCLVHGFISLRMKPGTTPGEKSYRILESYIVRFIKSL